VCFPERLYAYDQAPPVFSLTIYVQAPILATHPLLFKINPACFFGVAVYILLQVVESVAAHTKNPLFFPLSEKPELTAENAYAWTNGACLMATSEFTVRVLA